MQLHNLPLRLLAISLLLLGALITGCTTASKPHALLFPTKPADAQLEQPSTVANVGPPPTSIPAIRYGRYTWVELVAEPAQRDLMEQIVEVAMPPTYDATVGDALRHVLLRSGYRLCDNAAAAALYPLPLPAAHLHLGPLTLRETLLTLAGPAWDISVDEAFRQVCFEPHQAAPTLEIQP